MPDEYDAFRALMRKINKVKLLRFIGLFWLLALLSQVCVAQEADAQLYQLKVQYAKSLGLDTLSHIVNQAQLYQRNQFFTTLAEAYLPTTAIKSTSSSERLLVRQIFKKTPQNISKARLAALQQQMDSVYRQLQQGTPFQKLMQTCSDSQDTLLLQRLQMPEEFETRAFSMGAGQYSTPFLSPLGIHIIQVLDRTSGPIEPSGRTQQSVLAIGQNHLLLPALTETLKEELAYQVDEQNCKDLMRRGESDRVLFTIDGKAYTGTDFAKFQSAHVGSLSTALEQFVTKSLLDAKWHQMQGQTDLSSGREAFINDLLVAEATQREVIIPSQEEIALQSYFDTHQDEFRWPQERYKGILIQATSKKLAKKAAKLLKKKPYETWESLISMRYGDQGSLHLHKGIFARGDNPYIDELVFKGPDADPDPNYPYASVQGKKIKGPETYEGVPREQLAQALQEYLENQWEKRLKSLK